MSAPLLPVAAFLGIQEWWIILALALLFFGAGKLPGVARSLGQSVNEFKRGLKESPPEGPSSPNSNAAKN